MVRMIHEAELGALEARAHEARITMRQVCVRAKIHPQSWYRARKRGRAEYTLIDPLEKELSAIEQERSSAV